MLSNETVSIKIRTVWVIVYPMNMLAFMYFFSFLFRSLFFILLVVVSLVVVMLDVGTVKLKDLVKIQYTYL